MLTQDELDRRRHFLTATDVPKILGVSPWGGPLDVYYEKTRGLSNRTNDAMQAGNLLEPAVIAWAATQIGQVVPGDWKVHENGINACSLDGQAVNSRPVEAKTSGITGPGSPAEWGEPGTDQIPNYYLLQVQTQLLITGADLAYVPALIGNRGFVMYYVRPNPSLHEIILESSELFWRNHVIEQVPPEGKPPRLETLKRIRREPNKTVSVHDELVEAYLLAQKAKSDAEKAYEYAQAELLAALGDAEAAEYSGGVLTYYETTRKGFTVEESTFRVLRHKAAKVKRINLDDAYDMTQSALESWGYRLRETSPSGSRYYSALGLPDIRVSDHEANEATKAWMERNDVLEIRIDQPLPSEQLTRVKTLLIESKVPA